MELYLKVKVRKWTLNTLRITKPVNMFPAIKTNYNLLILRYPQQYKPDNFLYEVNFEQRNKSKNKPNKTVNRNIIN